MAEAARSTTETVIAGSIQGRVRTVLAALPIGAIFPNPDQPRRHFDPDALAELASSIATRGVLHPIIVKRAGAQFQIMAGERRYRAAQLAGLKKIPAMVRDDDPMEIAIIENVQRENLTPLEEAEGLGALADQYGYTHEELAALIGKSRPYVSNTLAMRRLPEHIKREYHAEPGVSREILISVARAESVEKQEKLWRLTQLRKLSVQRFRNEQAEKPGAYTEVLELARLVRRLGRRLRAMDTAVLPEAQREQVERLLNRTQSRVAKSLVQLRRERCA